MLTLEQKQALLARLPDFQLLADFDSLAQKKGTGAILAQDAQQVLSASAMGFDRKQIFYVDPAQENLDRVLSLCRIVVSSMEHLKRINEVSEACGQVTMVGLTLAATGFPAQGITTEALRGMVHEIKQLKHVSVCGCIVFGQSDGLHGKQLGQLIRSSYQTAKEMTYILPCSMPYICVADSLAAIARNEQEHPEDFEELLTTMNIVGMQNTTAFYADYYLQ